MPTASARCSRFEVANAWRARLRGAMGALPAAAKDELRALGFVAAVVVVLVVLQRLIEFAIDGTRPNLELARVVADTWDDAPVIAVIALAMFVVIQPVRRLGPQDGVPRLVAIVAAIALAGLVAAAISLLLMVLAELPPEMMRVIAQANFVQYALPAALLVTVGEFHRREVQSLEAMREAEADRARLEQQTLQARLKTLEAQIEPHFLFNTLANVRRLYEVDPLAGDAMLDRMMRYLETALPSMREERVTLGREADLIDAYLELQKVRMGRRLEFAIDIAPTLRSLQVPPMMLLTLVENAIKHGLAPQRGGGRIDVAAHVEGAELRLQVADTGRGFGGGVSGGGTGLANIQVRLATMFGENAQLTLDACEPRGLVATIRLPASVSS